MDARQLEQVMGPRLDRVNWARHTPDEWQLICDHALGVPWWFESAYEKWTAGQS